MTFITFCSTKTVEHTPPIFIAEDVEEAGQRGTQRDIASFSRSKGKSSCTLFFILEYLVDNPEQVSFVFSISMPKPLYSIDSG